MTDAERVAELVHYFSLLQTEESKLQYAIYLKQERDKGNKAAREALTKIIQKWMH